MESLLNHFALGYAHADLPIAFAAPSYYGDIIADLRVFGTINFPDEVEPFTIVSGVDYYGSSAYLLTVIAYGFTGIVCDTIVDSVSLNGEDVEIGDGAPPLGYSPPSQDSLIFSWWTITACQKPELIESVVTM